MYDWHVCPLGLEFKSVECNHKGRKSPINKITKNIIKFQKDLKHNGIPILPIAAFHGHIAVMNILLEAGADINAKDEKGNSALIVAISA